MMWWHRNDFHITGLLLTHWGRVTHICVSKLTIIGSDNGLSPDRRQTIIWTNAGLLLIAPLGTNFSAILIGILAFSFKKMRLKVSSAKRRPFCLGLNVLRESPVTSVQGPLVGSIDVFFVINLNKFLNDCNLIKVRWFEYCLWWVQTLSLLHPRRCCVEKQYLGWEISRCFVFLLLRPGIQSMRYAVTMYRRRPLADPIPRLIPGYLSPLVRRLLFCNVNHYQSFRSIRKDQVTILSTALYSQHHLSRKVPPQYWESGIITLIPSSSICSILKFSLNLLDLIPNIFCWYLVKSL